MNHQSNRTSPKTDRSKLVGRYENRRCACGLWRNRSGQRNELRRFTESRLPDEFCGGTQIQNSYFVILGTVPRSCPRSLLSPLIAPLSSLTLSVKTCWTFALNGRSFLKEPRRGKWPFLPRFSCCFGRSVAAHIPGRGRGPFRGEDKLKSRVAKFGAKRRFRKFVHLGRLRQVLEEKLEFKYGCCDQLN